MNEVVFPARVTITREMDPHGLPITRAYLDVDDESSELPLPAGRQGDPGPRGRPRAPWIKSGEVANAGALPSGLGPDDRGKWWHALDTNSMWTWTGSEWKESVDAAGPRGPVALGSTLHVTETISDPRIRNAGAAIARGDELRIVTPAGPQGPKGPIGVFGRIREASDYDDTVGPSQNSVFAWARNRRVFRPLPTPMGYGPWSLASSDFAPDSTAANTNLIELGQITIPALPFAWRPRVRGRVLTGGSNTEPYGFAHVWARLGSWDGQPVGHGRNPFLTFASFAEIRPYFSEATGLDTSGSANSTDSPPVKLTPSSTVGVVPAHEEVTIYLRVERASTSSNPVNTIYHRQAGAYFEVYAIPVAS